MLKRALLPTPSVKVCEKYSPARVDTVQPEVAGVVGVGGGGEGEEEGVAPGEMVGEGVGVMVSNFVLFKRFKTSV